MTSLREAFDLQMRLAQQDLKDQASRQIYNYPPEEETPVSTEFPAITIYPTNHQLWVWRNAADYPAADLIELLEELAVFLPTEVELDEGDIVEYGTGHTYEVVRLGDTEVVLKRLSASGAGPIGSFLIEQRSKTEDDLRKGKATFA